MIFYSIENISNKFLCARHIYYMLFDASFKDDYYYILSKSYTTVQYPNSYCIKPNFLM